MQTFRRSTVFQQGIISIIMSFNQRFEDMDRLRKVFLALDKSNDGQLTLDEIHEGLVTAMGRVKGNLKEF
jgi:Ca2+-binding EF-hand superfamily protein